CSPSNECDHDPSPAPNDPLVAYVIATFTRYYTLDRRGKIHTGEKSSLHVPPPGGPSRVGPGRESFVGTVNSQAIARSRFGEAKNKALILKAPVQKGDQTGQVAGQVESVAGDALQRRPSRGL